MNAIASVKIKSKFLQTCAIKEENLSGAALHDLHVSLLPNTSKILNFFANLILPPQAC
jgi:hypothetical protein